MNSSLDRITCASLPQAPLAALADLRCREDISVGLEAGRAWVRWPAGDDMVLMHLLPISGATFYYARDGQWFQHDRHLPAFGVPEELAVAPLHAVLTPER